MDVGLNPTWVNHNKLLFLTDILYRFSCFAFIFNNDYTIELSQYEYATYILVWYYDWEQQQIEWNRDSVAQ